MGTESIAGPAGGLLAGHFNQTRRYATRRPGGTDDWLLIFTRSGQGIFRWPGGQLSTRRGDLVLTRPGTPHDYGLVQPGEPWELQWVHFLPRPQWLVWLKWRELAPGLSSCRVTEPETFRRLGRRFSEMKKLSERSSRHHETLAMNALEEIILWCDEINMQEGEIDARIRRAVDLLNDLHSSLSHEEVARKVGLSSSRLAHLFVEQIGVTPRNYLEKRRLEQARQLLRRTQFPVAEIARQVGFESQFYFSLRFKKATGQAPLAFRQQSENT